ncbi:hypothetical protein PR048_025765 [Dryococelus australis]|uniref:Uncharacterized protein n=1 Tax=Dryococelus australis TaxID=614101 RepID=A0ABQ9GJF2_9NEOP|nr:hypothetical protein PR048_025765 [Dryococelus australis]
MKLLRPPSEPPRHPYTTPGGIIRRALSGRVGLAVHNNASESLVTVCQSHPVSPSQAATSIAPSATFNIRSVDAPPASAGVGRLSLDFSENLRSSPDVDYSPRRSLSGGHPPPPRSSSRNPNRWEKEERFDTSFLGGVPSTVQARRKVASGRKQASRRQWKTWRVCSVSSELIVVTIWFQPFQTFFSYRFQYCDMGDSNTCTQRPIALMRKALNQRAVLPLSCFLDFKTDVNTWFDCTGEILGALNIGAKRGRGERESPEKTPTTIVIVRHDSQVRKYGSDPARYRTWLTLMGGEEKGQDLLPGRLAARQAVKYYGAARASWNRCDCIATPNRSSFPLSLETHYPFHRGPGTVHSAAGSCNSSVGQSSAGAKHPSTSLKVVHDQPQKKFAAPPLHAYILTGTLNGMRPVNPSYVQSQQAGRRYTTYVSILWSQVLLYSSFYGGQFIRTPTITRGRFVWSCFAGRRPVKGLDVSKSLAAPLRAFYELTLAVSLLDE